MNRITLTGRAAAAVCLLFVTAAMGDSIPSPQAASSDLINFSALDYKGKYYELRRADARVVVLFFTGNGCPVARQSIDKLKALRNRYSDRGVAVWMINSNSQDDRDSIEKEADDFHESPLPVLIDDTQEIARSLGVKRTAEAVCIDTAQFAIFYHGALDDQLAEGAQKPEPTEKYVENALDQFLSGKNITRPSSAGRGCLITFDRREGSSATPISYTKEIAPLLQAKCVACHCPGDIAPFSMSSYQKVRGRADMIREVLVARRMPPWDADPRFGHFKNDRSLTLAQKKTLLTWIDQGAPQDAGPDPLAQTLPEAPRWPLGEPDYIVKLPTPQQIPATGIFDYRYVEISNPITNDVWLSAAVFRPDNRHVVHHLIARAKYENAPKQVEEEAFLTGWAPGYNHHYCPDGTGKFLGKGATLEIELHYTASGKPETDQSELGLYIMKSPPKLALLTQGAYNPDFVVPAHEPDSASYAIYGFKQNTMLYDLAPHMHLRGSWFKYEALYPTGKRETLLSVPHYDFNWQTTYILDQPREMPAGTWILCTGGFDNSEKNPSNPNPNKRIRWGDQSFDEMFIGFMDVAKLPPGQAASAPQETRDAANTAPHDTRILSQ